MAKALDEVRDKRVVGHIADHAPWLGVDAVLATCMPGQGALVPLLDARRRLHEVAGIPPWNPYRLRAGLSRRLLGDTDQTSVNDVIADLNHAASLRPNAVLVLEQAEHADADTVAVIRRAMAEPAWLDLPVLLLFSTFPTTGPAHALATALGLEAQAAPPPSPQPVPARALLALRAAAQIGNPFHVDQVADLLEWSPRSVLLALQQAADAGVALADSGSGQFTLPGPRVAQLRRGVLPSLAALWSGPRSEAEPPEALTPKAASPKAASPKAASPKAASPKAASPKAASPQAEPPPINPEPGTGHPPSMVLATAARQALDRGEATRAQALANRALQALDEADGPDTDDQRLLRASVLLDLAHAHWRGSGESTTLHQALLVADQARAALHDDDPVELVAGALSVGAGVRYDLGESTMLSEALDLLVEAARLLQGAGEPVAAASLLNDQAAVWIRLGDPVRAAHLLRKSREVFAESAAHNPEGRLAKVELAETEHLLARLPFHVASRPGLERDALRSALGNAETSAALYRTLSDPLSAARVRETQGRLLARLGELDEALACLREAAQEQQALRDALGLARTAGALAEVFAAQAQPHHAVRLLRDSVRLNLQVGTPLGLAQNRRSLEHLAPTLAASAEGQLALAEVRRLLDHAEQLVGHADLPPNLP